MEREAPESSVKITPTRDLSGVWKLGTPGVRQATEAALGGVQAATLLSSAVAGAQNVSTETSTSRPLAPRVPLTKLLGRRGLTRALLLLGSPLHSSASASSTSAAAASTSSNPPATATAASTSTAATEAPTSATTPTPTPSSASTATTAAPTTPSSSLAPLALADAAPLTRSRRSADRLGSPPVFKAHYVARGFSQREGVDFFHTFSPTPKITTLQVLLHVAAQRDYELHSLDFSTAFLQGSLHEEIWLRRPPGFTGSFPPGHSLSAPPSDESVEPSGPYPELVGCLMYLMACTCHDLAYPLGLLARYVAPGRHRKVHMDAAKRVLRYLCSTSSMGLVLGGRSPVVLTGHSDASWVDDLAMQRSSQGYTFSLGSGSFSWRSTRSSSVLSSNCEAEIYATAMAAQELRWLTYLLTDLGERPRSPPVLYVDNKAAIALCEEHRLEHRTKHISLGYFLARELQQRGQLRLAHVATWANTADIFTKALLSGDHQRFCTLLGLVPIFPHLL
ncbi:unnamed protein product [Closterium sp. NIES-54]